VDVVGRVVPSIPRTSEIFARMVGPWIRRIDGQTFELTPLITSIAKNAMDSEIITVRYLALAEYGRQMDYARRYADAKYWLSRISCISFQHRGLWAEHRLLWRFTFQVR